MVQREGSDVVLYRYRNAVILRARRSDGSQTPRLVAVPLGSHGEQFRPDAAIVDDAMMALQRLAGMSGPALDRGVRRFVARYGSLAGTIKYLDDLLVGGDLPADVVEVARDWRSSVHYDFATLEAPPIAWLPVGCYQHEAAELRKLLTLYDALSNDDVASVRDWFRHHMTITADQRRDLPDELHAYNFADEWTHAWDVLAQAINDYARLTYPHLEWSDARAPAACSWPDIPRPTFHVSMTADGILGLIYSQLAQWLVHGRSVRLCVCGQLFSPIRSDQTYCTKSCGTTARVRRLRAKRANAANGLQTGTAQNGPV